VIVLDKIVLASRNPNKIEEMNALFSDLGIKVYSALDFPALEEVEEDEPSLEGNALKKARYVHQVTGLPALSDDTGLEVTALNGAPGVFSARYAGENASYQDNVLKLLEAMLDKADRKAQFRTVLALVTSNEELTFDGICAGEIISEQKGSSGFGYDPIFKPNGFNETFAELDSSTKNEISHRGRAAQELLKFLKTQS